MPASPSKIVIVSVAFLLGCSPLFANEDRVEHREAPAAQEWTQDDEGNGGPPAVSGAESEKPGRSDNANRDTPADDAAGEIAPGRSTKRGASGNGAANSPAGNTTAVKTTAVKTNSVKINAATAANPAKIPAIKRDSQDGSPKAAAGKGDNAPEIAGDGGDGTEIRATETSTDSGSVKTKGKAGNPDGETTTAKESGGLSGAEKRIAGDDGEVGQAAPGLQQAEVSGKPPVDRDQDPIPDKKSGVSPGNRQVRQEPSGETLAGKSGVGKPVAEKSMAEATQSRGRLLFGKIGSTGDKVFPSSPGIDRQKEFWILIFTRYTTQQGVLHDGKSTSPIFQDLNFMGMGPRVQTRYIKQRKRQLALDLKILAEALRTGSQLTKKQLALSARMPQGVTAEEIIEYAGRIHFQRGLSDRFQEGITRSGALMGMMLRTMARYGLPEDLVYLPHVESSFVNDTLSRSGARGIWQFTRDTGRRYMRVGYLVDQRLDPVVATRSAARFLRRYYGQLKSWPLTLTSYNHGPVGIKRIIRKLGTRDLGLMIRDFKGSRFGFASKNFYAEFLAAREIAKNYRRYFGELKMDRPVRHASAKLPYYVFARDAARALGISQWRLRWMNPALRRTIWKGVKRIPKGYVLNIPARQDPLRFVAAIPKSARHLNQRPTRFVRVRRGDTLRGIGRRYGIPWRRIALANNISRGRIRRGQRLLLPLENRRPVHTATVAGLPAKGRKTTVNTATGNTPIRSNRIRNAIAGSITAGEKIAGINTAGDSIPLLRPRGKPNGIASSDDAGLGVSHLSASWGGVRAGTQSATTGSIGSEAAGGNTVAGTHDLALVNFDAKTHIGRIVAVFGESLGHYADWGNISARRLRRLNGFSYRRKLRNGEYLLVYLKGVDPETFTRLRVKYHRQLATTFFAENFITQRRRVQVTRGQSAWNLARKNNVPLWLFFRENPELLNNPMRIGMQVVVPVVEAMPSR